MECMRRYSVRGNWNRQARQHDGHFGHFGLAQVGQNDASFWSSWLAGGRMTRHICHLGPRFLKGEEGGWGRQFVNLGKGPRPRANTSFTTCATSTTCTTRPRIPLAQLASQDYQKIVKMPPPPLNKMSAKQDYMHAPGEPLNPTLNPNL